MLPILTLSRPACGNCLDLIISVYFVKAYWIMPFASSDTAKLKSTQYDKSRLIISIALAAYLSFLKFFSLFTAYLAFSNA